MNIAIFEDNQTHRFYPAAMTRPVWDIFCGSRTIAERIESASARFAGNRDNIFYYTRPFLADYYRSIKPDKKINSPYPLKTGAETFFINAALKNMISPSNLENGEVIVNKEGIPLAALITVKEDISPEDINAGILRNSLKKTETDSGFSKYNYLWDIIADNPRIITYDSETLKTTVASKETAVTGDPGALFLSENITIEPHVLFNLKGGPVIIEKDCSIQAFSRIEGPVFIGRGSVIAGAKIGPGTSIGEQCRIGGEVGNTIFQSFSNKSHEGYIGHSYIGEWVNMGALTTNSDLKNNYSTVSVDIPGEGRVETGHLKIGCFIGDFTKTSIGTLINTGTVTGPGAMLVHPGDMTPPHIPPFSWYKNGSVTDRNWLNSFIETSSRMLSRRNKKMSPELKAMLETIYEKSRGIRRDA